MCKRSLFQRPIGIWRDRIYVIVVVVVGFWAWVVHPMGLSPFCGVRESQLLVCVAVSTAAQDTPGARNEFVILLFEVAPEKIDRVDFVGLRISSGVVLLRDLITALSSFFAL